MHIGKHRSPAFLRFVLRIGRRCFALFLLLLFPVLISAQANKADSLRKVIRKSTTDTAAVTARNVLAALMINTSLDTSIALLHESVKISTTLQEPTRKFMLAQSYGQLGKTYNKKGDAVRALEAYDRSIALWDSLIALALPDSNIYTRRKTQIMGSLSYTYDQLGNYSAALECLLTCLAMNEKVGDKRGMANNLSGIGELYERQKDYAQNNGAEVFFNQRQTAEEIAGERE